MRSNNSSHRGLTFRRIVFSEYGPPSVLEAVSAQMGGVGRRSVAVRVKAAGVQPFDCALRQGRLKYRVSATFPQGLGNEFAGIVESVGNDVTEFVPGDEAMGWAMLSCYSEFVVVPADQVVKKPVHMSWAHAGVMSASGQTASAALDALGVGPGSTVLIHGAAGGVGTFAVQIARARGASVIGTASKRNHEYLASIGATPITYGSGLADRVQVEARGGVDAVLDTAGTEDALRSSLVVAETENVGTLTSAPAAARLGIRKLATVRSTSRLAELANLYTSGAIQLVCEAFPLERADDAHRRVETRHVRGKVVLIVE